MQTADQPPPPARGNVIPFPTREAAHLTLVDRLVPLAAGLRVLGEPATTEELSSLLVSVLHEDLNMVPATVDSLMCEFGPDAASNGRPEIFRLVNLRGEQAWAFTPWFRTRMSDLGLQISLRGVLAQL